MHEPRHRRQITPNILPTFESSAHCKGLTTMSLLFDLNVLMVVRSFSFRSQVSWALGDEIQQDPQRALTCARPERSVWVCHTPFWYGLFHVGSDVVLPENEDCPALLTKRFASRGRHSSVAVETRHRCTSQPRLITLSPRAAICWQTAVKHEAMILNFWYFDNELEAAFECSTALALRLHR